MVRIELILAKNKWLVKTLTAMGQARGEGQFEPPTVGTTNVWIDFMPIASSTFRSEQHEPNPQHRRHRR
jgi:hypothetical protein